MSVFKIENAVAISKRIITLDAFNASKFDERVGYACNYKFKPFWRLYGIKYHFNYSVLLVCSSKRIKILDYVRYPYMLATIETPARRDSLHSVTSPKVLDCYCNG